MFIALIHLRIQSDLKSQYVYSERKRKAYLFTPSKPLVASHLWGATYLNKNKTGGEMTRSYRATRTRRVASEMKHEKSPLFYLLARWSLKRDLFANIKQIPVGAPRK